MFSTLFESVKRSKFRSPFSDVQCESINSDDISNNDLQSTLIHSKSSMNNKSPVMGRYIQAANASEGDSCEFGSNKYFALCSIGGIVSCGTTHFLVTPLDLVKCRLQVDPGKYKNLINGFKVTVAEEGPLGLTRGWAPTLLGYSAQVCNSVLPPHYYSLSNNGGIVLQVYSSVCLLRRRDYKDGISIKSSEMVSNNGF